MIYRYEEAFGAWDKTTRAMREAVSRWQKLYYGSGESRDTDPCQRIAYTVVNKLVRTVFGEYRTMSDDPFTQGVLQALSLQARQAMQQSLIGGACFLKPCMAEEGFHFLPISRGNVLIFARDPQGKVTDMGMVERSTHGRYYYTLLERRTVDEKGYLTITNRLYRSMNHNTLGVEVSLNSHPAYEQLKPSYRYTQPIGSVGLVQVKTPMLNCVDGSQDGVSVYAAAEGLIRNIDENEAQLRGEFRRGQSRIMVSRDLLREDGQGNLDLMDNLFVGLDEDPEQLGITVFSPQLRQQSYLERKQEYLRNVETVIGLKRGMLSDANAEDRTATEISSSAGDYNLTVIDFQRMWEQAVREAVSLCGKLARIYGMGQPPEKPGITIDWGNGILYDEDKTWEQYRTMVAEGLLKPEIALGWRFQLPCQTEQEQLAIRRQWMPVMPL